MVFAHHINVLDGLEEAVQSMTYTTDSGMELRVGHMRIDGKTSSKLRSDRVKTFQGDEHCRVALLSIKAAGVRPGTQHRRGHKNCAAGTGPCLVPIKHLACRSILLSCA